MAKNDFDWKCEKCGKIYSTKSACEKHESNCNSYYECEICGEVFNTKLEREKHKKSHIKKHKKISENSLNINKIEEEIKNLEGFRIETLVFSILTLIGLFCFIIPGILFWILGNINENANKAKIVHLKTQLILLKKKKTNSKNENSLEILKKRFASGEITDSEYKKKKKLLED